MLCSYECGAKFQKRFFQKHVDRDCPKKIIVCPYCDDRHLREERKVGLLSRLFENWEVTESRKLRYLLLHRFFKSARQVKLHILTWVLSAFSNCSSIFPTEMPYRALELYCQGAKVINEAVQRIVTKKGKERCGSKSDSFSLLFIVSLLSNKTPGKTIYKADRLFWWLNTFLTYSNVLRSDFPSRHLLTQC